MTDPIHSGCANPLADPAALPKEIDGSYTPYRPSLGSTLWADERGAIAAAYRRVISTLGQELAETAEQLEQWEWEGHPVGGQSFAQERNRAETGPTKLAYAVLPSVYDVQALRSCDADCSPWRVVEVPVADFLPRAWFSPAPGE